ncbi:MAG: hypothetical protein IQL11_07360, partial [Bacteroidales bacterium]|nr:hypothetical protein [Bacteroidales bacterium]
MFGLFSKILLILLYILIPRLIYCQKFIYPEKNSFQGRFFNYPVTEPGADVSTYRLYFDRKGFLWQGTYTGIHRFDGIEYKSFYGNTSGSTGLAGNTVTDIYEDSSGILWIATFGALNRLDQKSWTLSHFSPDTSDLLKPCNRIFLIHEDREGLLWLLTGEDVFTFDRNSETFKRYSIDTLSYITGLFPLNKTGRILEDSAGEIWITSNFGLYKY